MTDWLPESEYNRHMTVNTQATTVKHILSKDKLKLAWHKVQATHQS